MLAREIVCCCSWAKTRRADAVRLAANGSNQRQQQLQGIDDILLSTRYFDTTFSHTMMLWHEKGGNCNSIGKAVTVYSTRPISNEL